MTTPAQRARDFDGGLGWLVQGGLIVTALLLVVVANQHDARLERLEEAIAPVTTETP